MELNILVLMAVLMAAWVFGAAATRFGYPAVIGELLAGIVLGPALLGFLGAGGNLEQLLGIEGGYTALEPLAHLGVLLMMLYIGMEIDAKELGKASWGGILAALGGFATPFALGVGVMLLFGQGLVPGLFVAIGLGVTSLAVNSGIITNLRILDTRIAQMMLAGALIADLLTLLVFAGVLPFAQAGAVDLAGATELLVSAVVFFAVVSALGIWIFPAAARILRRAGLTSMGAYFMLLVLIAFLFAKLADVAGLHPIVGTFFAGLYLRKGMLDPRASRELTTLVRTVSVSFLAPIFFVLTGFYVTLEVFRTDLWLLIVIIIVAFVGKVLGTMLFYLPTRHGWREGLVLGAGMNGRGAVEIILAQLAFSFGLISQQIFSILVIMAIVTTATAPLLLKLGTNWLKARGELAPRLGRRDGAIIIGASRTARALAKLLAEEQPVTLVDSNISRVEDARREGLTAIGGNALETEILSEARAPLCSTFVVMTGNAQINVLAAQQMRQMFDPAHMHVLSLGSGQSEDPETLELLKAGSLFAQAVALQEWDHWFARDLVTLERIPSPEGPASDVAPKLIHDYPVLPLAVERQTQGGKRILPYHSRLTLTAEDTLVVARARVILQPDTDHFDEFVEFCPVLDINRAMERDEFFEVASSELAKVLSNPAEEISAALHERESQGSTILTPGLAMPHAILSGKGRFGLVVVRCLEGVNLDPESDRVYALFVLAGSQDQRNFHLKALSAIAQIWQSPDFESRWRTVLAADDLRRLVVGAPRQRTAFTANVTEAIKVSPTRGKHGTGKVSKDADTSKEGQ
jgi:Kef-type K+ transport system membrane component KefB/mannitol/fructose-specific phosphotransferase system IIA component (Ntr-type)